MKNQNLLQLKTSIFSDNGQSSQLANEFVSAWLENNDDAKVVVRDLAQEPVPHLDAERFLAFLSKPEERKISQQTVIDYSDRLINEVKAADVIVLGLPMYNYGLPSTLKAYFDHIARAGVTFKYTDTGPVGLLSNKKVYVFATRGGLYAGTSRDTQTGYIREFLNFLGISDVEFIYAEGLAMGDAQKEAALTQAHETIRHLNETVQAVAA